MARPDPCRVETDPFGIATATRMRRPWWRGLSFYFAGLSFAAHGFTVGILVPLANANGGFAGDHVYGILGFSGAPGGIDVSGAFFPDSLALWVLMPLGIASLAAAAALLADKCLPLLVVAALWLGLAVGTVVLSDDGGSFLAAEAFLLALALVVAWPELRAPVQRRHAGVPKAVTQSS